MIKDGMLPPHRLLGAGAELVLLLRLGLGVQGPPQGAREPRHAHGVADAPAQLHAPHGREHLLRLRARVRRAPTLTPTLTITVSLALTKSTSEKTAALMLSSAPPRAREVSTARW